LEKIHLPQRNLAFFVSFHQINAIFNYNENKRKQNMGTSWGQIVKEESKRSPGIADYTKCQSGVFAYSTLAMVAGNFF
jgi:hypothetical protein